MLSVNTVSILAMRTCIDASSDAVREHSLHPCHENLQSLDHGNDFDQSKLLLRRIIVASSSLILFSVLWALLVLMVVCWVEKFPAVELCDDACPLREELQASQ